MSADLRALVYTHPSHDIARGLDGQGWPCITATLQRPITTAMRAAGVQQVVEEPDVPTMASTLSDQARRIRRTRNNRAS
ncbi:hypothetical protein [Nonomuraea insulae]|uniref:Uncharacterized protein n=1 Tax=Nonomuraea insulae TaxID=1616787 RepID=A0ABW1D7I8_9ACTN